MDFEWNMIDFWPKMLMKSGLEFFILKSLQEREKKEMLHNL